MRKSKLLTVVFLLVIVTLACNMPSPSLPSVTSPEPPIEEATQPVGETTPEIGPTAPPGVRGSAFAAYPDIPVLLPAAYQGPTLPLDMGTVGTHSDIVLSEGAQAMLAQNGFVVVPAEWKEFYLLYDEARYQEMPIFVTTDSVYHVYHLIFDKMLRDLEQQFFEPDIRLLTRACLEKAITIYDEMKGTDLEEQARQVVAYFAVADALISPDDPAVTPPEIAGIVAEELALIEAHEGFSASPIFGVSCPAECDPCDTNPPEACLDQPCMCEDYSQYVPRGHYTRTEQLQNYFRAMMWYGRINMRLQKPNETRMALLITYILRNTDVGGTPAADVWARIYDPTVFIVGKSDDLGFYEYGTLWDSVFGANAPPADIADEARITAFIDAARHLPPPQINSMWVYIWEDKEQVTQGFRFMGQRFVLDAYIFDEMTWREVGEMGNERWLPAGLDVMAAFGSEEAYTVLDEMGETAYVNYPEQMTRLREEVAGLGMDSWTQNLYWSWLYSFMPLLEVKGAPYPAFMQTQAWARKDIHTALGSWTELKHDTILYAKQTMAEMGGAQPPEPPRGWVEPNPEVYARLLALTRMTRDGLESRGLLTAGTDVNDTGVNLQRLDDLLVFLQDVSQRELAGETLTTEDYERIKYYGGELEAITLAAADKEGEGFTPYFDEPEPAALVADVATGSGTVLEEAIGRIFEIFVAVPDGKGGLHIAKGGVFSYFEFPWDMSDRLTDEKWREMLDNGTAPAQPEWTGSFIVP
ncbi:MAG: DUF3160 domain-containing protein [Anaerolineae bacterium]|nr:DUF3160 domain-containing protein [Anaerolineae bacterium]